MSRFQGASIGLGRLSKIAFFGCALVLYNVMEENFSINSYFLENDFTEDFLKGCLYDVPGEREALQFYALDTLI